MTDENKKQVAENKTSTLHASTLAIREGVNRSHEGEHAEAMFLTSSYVFDSAEHAAQRFSGEEPGNVYSRYTNPTVRAFEERFAAIEQAESAVATSSGMAAIHAVFMTLLSAGDQILCSKSVFGSTVALLDKFFKKMHIDVQYVDATDYAAWQTACTEQTKLMFVETPSNPLNTIVDIAQLATIAKQNNTYLIVDNTYCTPLVQKPLSLGADLVVYSTTKYIDGQGRALGGVVTGNEDLVSQVLGFVRSAGPSMSPFNAWLFLKGLETLELRMQRHCDNALTLANYLHQHSKVQQVYYAGLESNVGHALAKSQHLGENFGAVVSFDIAGDKAAAWRVIDAVEMISRTANLGDAKSTIVHPATTTHSRLSQEARDEAGISDALVRISVGLENVNDLIADVEQALAAI